MKKAIGTIGILLSLLTLSLEIYALPLLQYTEAAGHHKSWANVWVGVDGGAALVPEDDGAGLQTRGHVDQPLIGRAAEPEIEIFERRDERPVDQHVEI